jgi:hypothetical protein
MNTYQFYFHWLRTKKANWFPFWRDMKFSPKALREFAKDYHEHKLAEQTAPTDPMAVKLETLRNVVNGFEAPLNQGHDLSCSTHFGKRKSIEATTSIVTYEPNKMVMTVIVLYPRAVPADVIAEKIKELTDLLPSD